MQSHEERVNAVKRRIAAENRKRSNRRIAMACVTASLLLVVGLSVAMPGIVERISLDISGFEMAASIFGNGTAVGYVVIGLISFILGVCVTILCLRIRSLKSENPMEDNQGGKENDRIH